MRGIDLAIGSRLTGLATGAALAYWTAGAEAESRRTGNAYWSNRLPNEFNSITAVVYAGGLAWLGTGLGRYPLSGRLVAYSVSQALMVIMDGYVLGRIATRRAEATGSQIFVHSEIKCRVQWSALPLVATWFSCRLLDGWYRASMPVDTLPFASLVTQTRVGSHYLSPLLAKITTWGRAMALLPPVIRFGSAVGRTLMKVTDLLISSRFSWLLSGGVTTCVLGGYRACDLQDGRLDYKYCGTKGDGSEWHEPSLCCGTKKTPLIAREVNPDSLCKEESCKKPYYQPPGAKGRYHEMNCVLATWKLESSLPLTRQLIGGRDTMVLLGAYSLILLAGVTAGGRVPLSGRSIGYLAGQVGMKWLDTAVLGKCFIDRMGCDCDRGGEAILKPTQVQFASAPWVTAGIVYFGLRAADCSLMASMPINTAPWLSLGSRLLSVSS
jgi:hypothetical protein